MDLITVIIPVYNVEKYLTACIESVVNQTYQDLQIILIDDGSMDASPQICDKYAEEDHRIVVIHKVNEGVSKARNVGLDLAEGKYVMFVDSDDWIEPHCIQSMIDLMKTYLVQIVSAQFYINDDKGNQIPSRNVVEKVISGEEALNCYSPYYFTSCWGKLYSVQVIKNIRFRTEYYYSEDTLFYTEALFVTNSVFFTNKKLYHYRSNPLGATNSINLEKRMTDFFAREKICEMYKAKENEHLNGAVCRTIESACALINLSNKHNLGKTCDTRILSRYIRSNIAIYIRFPDIPSVTRLEHY